MCTRGGEVRVEHKSVICFRQIISLQPVTKALARPHE
jgi:hypothetical protein